MKKIVLSIAVAVMCALSVFGLVACDDKDQSATVGGLQYETKYISSVSINFSEFKHAYYIFHSNGTGYLVNEDQKTDFKYTYIDGDHTQIVCFYTLSSLMSPDVFYVSKNIIKRESTGTISIYVNENYAETLKGF